MEYKLINKNSISILTLQGSIDRSDKESIINCTNEILNIDAKSVVIYFKNTLSIDPLIFRELTLLQHEIRKKNMIIRVVGLNLQLKTVLGERGVIRSNEAGVGLSEVLCSLGKPD